MIKTNRKFTGLFCFVFFILLFLGAGNGSLALAKSDYYYHSIDVDIQINRNGTFDVTEKQTYNLNGSFGYFYRDIELKDLDHISDIEVFDNATRKLSGNEYKISYEGNRMAIRWDFPRKLFNNELKSWTIKYKVHGGLGFYGQSDELYWNAIFADREVQVSQAEIIVHLPQEVEKDKIGQKLFIGRTGSKIQGDTYEVIDNKTVRFWGNNIEPGNFLTIVMAWPKGIVEKPFLYRNQIINWMVLLVSLALPIFTFIRMYGVWSRKGKDPKVQKTIMAHYSPPESLPPAIFGVLIDQKVDMKDITATVIDLAVRGYLRIVEGTETLPFFKKQEYIFEKLRNEHDLKPFEQRIIKGIFGHREIVSSNKLKNKFYKEIPEIKELIHKEVATTGYFTGNIESIRKEYSRVSNYIFLFIFFLFFTWILTSIFLSSGIIRYFAQALILGLSLIITAAIINIFAHYMPSVTKKGLDAKWKLLGFKEYLYTAERFRLGVETLDTFSKFLPCAMVLGVEKRWAARFSEFSYEEQNWYVQAVYAYSGGRVGGAAPISFNDLSASISSFSSSISRTFSSGARAGGTGGFGGGGGAGGGGGGGGGGAG